MRRIARDSSRRGMIRVAALGEPTSGVRVSVALAAYNGERYIEAQLRSILGNLNANDQVVVSDDGSTDGTVSVVEHIASTDPRVTLVAGPGRGVIANFEHALRLCTGQVIFLSDQDDVWRAGKVSSVLESFRDPEVLCVVHDVEVVDQDLAPIHPSYFALRASGPGLVKNWVRVTYLGAAMAFRASLLPVVIPIPENATMHDQWIGAMAEMYGRCVFLPRVLGVYRRHDGNQTLLNQRGTVASVLSKRASTAGLLLAAALRSRNKRGSTYPRRRDLWGRWL